MRPLSTPWSRLFTVAAIAAAAIAALSACGGSAGSPAFDPKKADALAHTALITNDELPGNGWSVSSTDEFNDNEKLADSANTAACKAVDARKTESNRASTKDREGRANVSLGQEAGANETFPVSVDESISIFTSNSVPDAAMKIFREVVSSRDFGTCMSDVMKAEVASGVDVKLVDAKPSRSAPEGGLATAFRIDISAPGEQASMQLEFYVWRYENAGVSVQLSGPPEKLDAKLVGGALDAATKALKATAKK